MGLAHPTCDPFQQRVYYSLFSQCKSRDMSSAFLASVSALLVNDYEVTYGRHHGTT